MASAAQPQYESQGNPARPGPRVASILGVHNFYQQAGGEDQVFHSETDLLRQHGHGVIRYETRNDLISTGILTGLTATWNHPSYRALRKLTKEHHIDVAHFHNTFPIISPSAYYAMHRARVPVVQTLHNFRLICPGATLFRNGEVCEDCVREQSFKPAIEHACYRGSKAATSAVVTMLTAHRKLGTFKKLVDVYIAPSDIARRRFIKGGIPRDRIVVKPSFVLPDPGPGDGRGNYALYVGRLTAEKGIPNLARAWRKLRDLPLRVIGDGPLRDTDWPDGVTWFGNQAHDQVMLAMKAAKVVIVPSEWYEIGPLTILEAMACGTPVICPLLGSMGEKIRHGYNGLVYRPGDAAQLAEQVRWAFSHPEEMAQMRVNARREFEQKYTAERNYRVLINIYDQAIDSAKRRGRNRSGR